MGFFSDLKEKLSDATEVAEDRIEETLASVKEAFDEEADVIRLEIDKRAPCVAFAVTSAAADLSAWYDENGERIEATIADLRDAAAQAWADAESDIHAAAETFVDSAAYAEAEKDLDNMLDKARTFYLDACQNDAFG